MDEPASALDPIATQKVEELIQELKKKYTIVIVTIICNRLPGFRISQLSFIWGSSLKWTGQKKSSRSPKMKRTEDYVTGRFRLK